MTKEQVENTLLNLRATINIVKSQGKTVDRIIIGVGLLGAIRNHTNIIGSRNNKTIFGIPFKIDLIKEYCLEVATIHRVPVEGNTVN